MAKRFWAILVSAVILLVIGFNPNTFSGFYLITAESKPVKAQIAYAQRHYNSPNEAKFGNLGDVDCANFVSQTLFARGWHMTPEWFNKNVNGEREFGRAWISSTALHDYIQKHNIGKELTWKQRDQVKVGDIVQFDWDNSGDRDHTAIVSSILVTNNTRELLLAQHSVGAFDIPITVVLAMHPGPAKIYFWHLGKDKKKTR
jgi:hypothetical protein